MLFEHKVKLAGSDNVQRPGLTPDGNVSPTENVEVTVVLRHKQGRMMGGADPADLEKVEEWAHEIGFTVVEASAPKRRVVLAGTAGQCESAFGAELVCYRSESGTYRGRKGTLSIPSELADSVLSILGLDERPVAKPHIRPLATTPAGSFTPIQVATAYNFPTNLNGKGQTVAIIELGGGYKASDLTAYFKGLGLKAPTVTAVSVSGGRNKTGSDADGEVLLDIEVVGAIANGARIAVYFAPNTDAGFVNAITNAVHDTVRKPSVVSISWGGPEDSWSVQSRNAMNAALQDAATAGVTVTVASGDNGSTDGLTDGKLHVDFPASSPFALACGGTKLQASGNKILSEAVWNEAASGNGATGGGVSTAFPLPDYQKNASIPAQGQTGFAGRGVPDISGNADPTTGYQVRVDGKNIVVGGTSAVAPLWAALIAKINQSAGKPVGFINPTLYRSGQAALHDIVNGNNDDANLGYYTSSPGWDPCTGLGTPNGNALLQLLSSGGQKRVPLPGSETNHASGTRWTKLKDADKEITATVILRRSGEDSGDLLLSEAEPALHHGSASTSTAASEEDVAELRSFVQAHGLTLSEMNVPARSAQITGPANAVAAAFGVDLKMTGGNMSYRGSISLPDYLQGRVTAVLGLDQRPIAKHHITSA